MAITADLIQDAQQGFYAALATNLYYIPHSLDFLENLCPDQGASPLTPKRLSFGQRAIRMEAYLSRGTTFECRRDRTSADSLDELNRAFFDPEQRAALVATASPPTSKRLSFGQRAIRMEAYIQRATPMEAYPSPGTTLECRRDGTSADFFDDLDEASCTPEPHATLVANFIKRRAAATASVFAP